MNLNNPTVSGRLESFAALAVKGADSARFLQGQCSINVEKLAPGQQRLACFCTPKGRVVALVQIQKTDSGFILFLPADNIENLYQHLQKYKVFFRQCTLEKQTDRAVKVSIDGSPDLARLKLSDQDDLAAIDANYYTYLASRRISWLDADASELFLPHNLNLPALGGVDFDKGCFTGQEIIARMHYRGKLKSHLQLFICEQALSSAKLQQQRGIPSVVAGTKINADGQNAGTLICAVARAQAAGSLILAEVKDEALQAQKISLDIENLPILELVSHEEQKDNHS